MWFVEVEVLPGSWRVLSTGHSKVSSDEELWLLRKYSTFGRGRNYRAVKVLPS